MTRNMVREGPCYTIELQDVDGVWHDTVLFGAADQATLEKWIDYLACHPWVQDIGEVELCWGVEPCMATLPDPELIRRLRGDG